MIDFYKAIIYVHATKNNMRVSIIIASHLGAISYHNYYYCTSMKELKAMEELQK